MQTAQDTTPAPVQAESTYAFINSIGVVTHNNDADDAYATLQPEFVSEMQYLGISLAGGSLDGISFTGGGGLTYLHVLESEMSQGIRFDMSVSDNMPVATAISELNQLETLYPGMIAYVTGQNEVGENDPNIEADMAAAQNYQDQLYAAIKADPLLSSIGDITYSLGTMVPSVYTSLGNQSANTAYGNVHSYAGPFPPQIYDSFYTLVNTSTTPNDPFVVTETGYASTGPGSPPGGGFTYQAASEYALDSIFDFLLDGASAVELYELLDQFNDPNNVNGTEDHFGFFTTTGQAKPIATALHNLTSILADPGRNAASFTPGTLSYSVSGLDSTLNTAAAQAAFGYGIFNLYVANNPVYGASYLLEKSNGTYDIAVWQEPEIWDQANQTQIPVSATPVTVTLGQTAQSVEIYDPLVGTSPIATFTDVSSVTVMVTASPIVIEVDPFAAGTTPAASTSPPVVNVGSGPDTLTLFVAGSGQPGGAQFTVSINGLQIGGVQTTSAISSNDQSQQFNFSGAFAQGANSIAITYLNANNSVLSVDSIDINGTYVPGSYSTLGNDGTLSSTATQSTGPAAVALGSGPNTLDLFFSENGQAGAQFTISVNGQQIGGVQTTTAIANSGQVQQFDVSGTFTAGNNLVTIDYLNASNSTLYLDSATINGVGISASSLTMSNNGNADLSFSQSSGGPGPVTLGSGADTLAVFVSDRGQNGPAAFTITVDGQQYGGVLTTTADSTQGQTQEFDLLGNFGVGNHTVAVDYLNANNSLFFVNGATIDETAVVNSSLFYGNSGTLSFGFAKPGIAVPLAVTAPIVSTPVVVVPSGGSSGAPANTTGSSSSSSSSTSSSAPATSSIGTVTIGSGSDTLALSVSERGAANGDQFTVSVDGQQIGGVQTTTANSVAGQSQTFDVAGTFAAGNHTVSVDFLNASNSLLMVNNAAIDGSAVANSNVVLSNTGVAAFGFTEAGGTAPQVVGYGLDTLALAMSERGAGSGDQFTISVDGQQVGGVETTTANSVNGQSQVFDVLGNFGGGNHTVSVDFLNANNSLLTVNSASIDGNAISGSNTVLSNNGVASFGFAEPSMPVSDTGIGAGPDKLDLFTSERGASNGAQFTVSVDGQQIGGVETTTANYSGGQEQEFDLLGNFAPGNHTVSVDYLNANNSILFVNTATINGATINGSSLVDTNNGASGFSFATPAAPAPTTIGSGPDTLALNISEDYYQGNAQFTVSVDGKQVGGTQTAQAIAGNGQSQVLDVLGNFSGSHTVSINYLNDVSGAQPSQGYDRNLFVGGATVDGTSIANSTLGLYYAGTQSFSFSH